VRRAAVSALERLEQFGDAVLTAYATTLRTTPQLRERRIAGEWTRWAQRRLGERSRAAD
jgi:hypothetical protein